MYVECGALRSLTVKAVDVTNKSLCIKQEHFAVVHERYQHISNCIHANLVYSEVEVVGCVCPHRAH